MLVCEDETSVREFVCGALARKGYEVLPASSGEEALEMAMAREEAVELLLTDVIMPGMNGRELAERIKEERPGTEVLFMTGHASDVLVHRNEVARGIELLEKPFTASKLLRRVRATLDGRN